MLPCTVSRGIEHSDRPEDESAGFILWNSRKLCSMQILLSQVACQGAAPWYVCSYELHGAQCIWRLTTDVCRGLKRIHAHWNKVAYCLDYWMQRRWRQRYEHDHINATALMLMLRNEEMKWMRRLSIDTWCWHKQACRHQVLPFPNQFQTTMLHYNDDSRSLMMKCF